MPQQNPFTHANLENQYGELLPIPLTLSFLLLANNCQVFPEKHPVKRRKLGRI
jgi:hypothetical protein